MTRKVVAIGLLFFIIMSSIFAYAEPGDIIHTGLKKIYKQNEYDLKELRDDILENINNIEFNKKFYREIENKKYINILEEENKQIEALEKILINVDIKNPDDVEKYLKENADFIEKELNKIPINSMEFNDIPDENKGNLEDYQGASSPMLLDEKYFSPPEPGFREKSTKISKLKLPTGATKWLVKILDKEDTNLQKDIIINNGIPYYNGMDIEVDVGKILGLYAVDNSNKLKAYANIEIVKTMIKNPRELATKIEIGSIKEGKKHAGAVSIEGLTDGEKWRVMISNTPITQVYKDMAIDKTFEYIGEDIIVVKEEELHPIRDNFRKYLLLLKIDENGYVEEYNSFEINKKHISIPPTRLEEVTHYQGPVPNEEDGTTKFEGLYFGTYKDENMEKATSWKALVTNQPINVPKLDVNIKEMGTSPIEDAKIGKIKANVGDYLLLAATDDEGNIKGYRIFTLTENMVKGKTAIELSKDNYSIPTKGTVQGTTKIDYLSLESINEATKWMYKVGTKLDNPILNKVVDGSRAYLVGENIRANVGDTLLLLATDNEGKVKAFARIELDKNMVKDSPAILLQKGVNYIGPVKGSKEGTTKFEALSGSTSIGEKPTWMYVVQDEEPEVPEFDSKAKGTAFNIGEDIKVKSGQYLILLATDKNKTKGYAIFKLTEANIKMSNATKLIENTHYSEPEKGLSPSTTRITKLKYTGIEGVDQWRIKISNERHLEENESIELDSIIPQTSIYREGDNVKAKVEDWLLLLATDRVGRVKAYAEIQLNIENIRKPNAPLLRINTNYTEPEPGTVENSTRFGFLDFSTNIENATKWIYKVDNENFGTIELDSIIEGSEYTIGSNIENISVGNYLLLLAADNDGKIKGYREFRLTDRNIRGSVARKLTQDNFTLEKGSKPGTTRFNKLVPLGMEGTIRWRYKLLDNELENKPYLNSLEEETTPINVGQDIDVGQSKDYGYLLLLAVDGGNRTKGYVEMPIKSDIVKEHAPKLEIDIGMGKSVDTIKLINTTKPEGTNEYKIVLDSHPYPTPAKDEILSGGKDYSIGDDIQVRLNEYLTVFAVDEQSRIKAYRTFKIEEYKDKIKQGKAKIKSPNIILEGSINNGGKKVIIELSEGAKWTEDIKTNRDKLNALYNSFKTNTETTEWNKVLDSLIADGSGAIHIDDDNTTLTISLPETKNYNITQDQEISLTIPAIAMDAINPIEASGSIIIKPTIKAIVSGDVVESIVREKDIEAGGKTIVIELEDGNWVVNIDKDSLIDGFKVNGDSTNWNKIASAIKSNGTITRNSSKKVTITLPQVSVNLGTKKEIVSLTIPSSLVQNAETDIEAIPTFTLYPNMLQVMGEAIDDTVFLEAPDGRIPRHGINQWKIKVTTGTLKEDISDKDIVVSGLPRGLKTTVEKVDKDTIIVKVSGTASTKIENQIVNLSIKGTAVEELNSIDSDDIELKLVMAESLNLSSVDYEIKDDGIYLSIPETSGLDAKNMEYSLNSTNGTNGSWNDAPSNLRISTKLEPIRIWIREKAQPKVFKEVVNLKYDKAPEGISISKVKYMENNKVEKSIELQGIDSKTMEYSIDNGENWNSFNGNTFIKLDENSNLVIRYKTVNGIGGKLPSLWTKRLNGLYLGNVEINAGESKITNTNTSMEYSLNSNDGLGGNWTAGKNNETFVNLTKNNQVWIRERGNPINTRNLGTIGQEKEPVLDKVNFDISANKISNQTGQNLEYRIAGGQWHSIGSNEDILDVEFKAGKLEFRATGTAKTLASTPVEKATIKAPAPPPELKADDDKKIVYYFDETWKEINDEYQYKIGSNGDWKKGTDFINDSRKTEDIIVYVRKAATPTELPSLEKSITFTKNLDFENLVEINVLEGYIDGTTNKMEYSINSTNGMDGKWITASNGKTSISFIEGMSIWIREKGKPSVRRLIAENIKKQDKPVLKHVSYNIATGKISNSTEQNLEFRISDGDWKRLDGKSHMYEIEFSMGRLEFRKRATKDMLSSDSELKAIIKAPASAPVVKYDDVKNVINSINNFGSENSNKWKLFEYRVNGSYWKTGELLTGEDFSGDRTVDIRIKATDDKLPSQIFTFSFTKNLPLEHVQLSTHVYPMELNGTTTDMKYNIYLKDNRKTGWKTCTNHNTKLPNWLKDINIVEKIIIRDKNQPSNQYIVYPQE